MKKLIVCMAVIMLLLAACGETPPLPEKQAKVDVTQIDMAAPENEKLQEWLDAYLTRQGNLPEPSARTKKRPDDKAFKEWLGNEELPDDESWKTWDWNEAWEVELYYCYQGSSHWFVLRARNKATDETQLINEAFCWSDGDAAPDLVSFVDESHLLYELTAFEYTTLYLFTLEQGSVQITQGNCFDSWAFADEECTLLFWNQDYDDKLLYFLDLRKMVSGENNAAQELNATQDLREVLWSRSKPPAISP